MAQERQFIIFTLKEQEFGIDVNQTREILKPSKIHPLPQAPDFVEGVINLRRHIITVIDLRKRLGVEVTQCSGKTRIIMVKIKDIIVGFIADSVVEILPISNDSIESSPKVGSTQIYNRCISNIARVGERVIIILNVEQLLDHEDIGQLKKATDAN